MDESSWFNPYRWRSGVDGVVENFSMKNNDYNLLTKCFFIKALPDPVFKYFSKPYAKNLFEKAI
jgi:hypothetical protein